jgi:ribbon-helix-helix CopG family protein
MAMWWNSTGTCACLFFTDVVKCGAVPLNMNANDGDRKSMKAQSVAAVRATISFPPDVYETLESIAKEKKVSLAWVVREAAERYIADKWPLFGTSREE